jgi:putative membrane protein
MFFWIILVALAVVLLMSYSGRHGYYHHHPWPGYGEGGSAHGLQTGGAATKTPLELLDERYARGEIEREDYLRRKQDLLGH